MDGKKVVCIHVPMADFRMKPIYLNGNVYKGTYRRNHEGDYHCTERQVRAMIRDSFEDGNDGILIEHYNMDDIDLDTLHRYRTLFRVWNNDHVWNEVDDKTFLRNLGGYIVNREEGKEGLSMAGLMMDAGILRIEKHDDRLCFRNPGLLRLPIEQIYEGGNSKARNPRIQNMLRMVGFGENIGSGFPKIIAAWKETDWGEPELKNKIEVDEVELVLPVPATANGIKDDTKDGIKDSQKSSQKSSQKIIELIQENPNVTTSEMAEKIGVTRRAIAKITSALQTDGVIRRVGPDKGGHWELR